MVPACPALGWDRDQQAGPLQLSKYSIFLFWANQQDHLYLEYPFDQQFVTIDPISDPLPTELMQAIQ
jgi:hypothetical protein